MTDIATGGTPPGAGPRQYDIRVAGRLAARWATWFDGMTVTALDDGTTVLHGSVTDQSALHGLLNRLSDLGLPLVSVTPTAAGPATPTSSSDGRPVAGTPHPRSTT